MGQPAGVRPFERSERAMTTADWRTVHDFAREEFEGTDWTWDDPDVDRRPTVGEIAEMERDMRWGRWAKR